MTRRHAAAAVLLAAVALGLYVHIPE